MRTYSIISLLLLSLFTLSSVKAQDWVLKYDSLYAIWSDSSSSEVEKLDAFYERFNKVSVAGQPEGNFMRWMDNMDAVLDMAIRNEKEEYLGLLYFIAGGNGIFEEQDPEKGCGYLQKSIEYSRRENNPIRVLEGWTMMAWSNCPGISKEAVLDTLLLLEANLPQDSINNEFLIAIYSNLGTTLQEQSRYPEAIKYLHKARDLYEKDEEVNKSGYVFTLNVIGLIHKEIGNNKEAEKYLLAALNVAREMKDTMSIGSSYIALAEVSLNERNDEKAMIYLDTALYIMKEVESCIPCYVYARRVRAGVNNLTENYDAALEELLDLKQYYKEKFSEVATSNAAEFYNELAETYLGLGQNANAVKYAKRALDQAKGNLRLASTSYDVLYKAAEARGDFYSAYHYHLDYSTKRDSLADLRNSQEVTRFELENQFTKERFEDSLAVAQQQLENRLAFQTEINRQKNSRNIIIAFGVVLFLLAIALFSRLRYVRKTEVVLKEKNRIIEAEKERAKASERAKHQFLANMSHEIRTPMNAIKGMTDILLRRDPKKEQLEYLSGIKQSSDSLLVIINDILDLSKVEAGKVELEKVAFSPASVIRNVRTIMQFKAEEKGLQLQSNVPADLPNVIGDTTRLHQVLVNLVGNAVKFTEKGMVTISVETQPLDERHAEFMFTVSDTGVGIGEDRLSKIFESFEQAYSDTSRKFGGTGLGLSISKKLVEIQGGEIWVESDKGKGSKFFFTIPYPITDQVAGSEHAEAVVSGEGTPKLKGTRVLLVEDNAFNAIVAQEELEDAIEEVRVEVAENGAIAFAKLESGDYDVILMDVQMPVMNGFEATQKIRAMANGKAKIPIIAMTANVLKEEVDNCYAAGMDDFIGKPFNTDELLRKIYDLLTEKRTNDRLIS